VTSLLELKKVSLSYPSGFKLNDISFSLAAGDCLAIVGPSGCGKSSILKTINRLVEYDSGEIVFDGLKLRDYKLNDLRHRVSYMFQRGLLFPHLTVAQNLLLAFEGIRVIASAAKQSTKHGDCFGSSCLAMTSGSYAASILESCELDPQIYARRKPRELSGGELQRAALALALVSQPKLLMLDEPFTGLDAETKTALIDYLKRMQAKFGMAILLVSHSAEEVESLATNVYKIGAAGV